MNKNNRCFFHVRRLRFSAEPAFTQQQYLQDVFGMSSVRPEVRMTLCDMVTAILVPWAAFAARQNLGERCKAMVWRRGMVGQMDHMGLCFFPPMFGYGGRSFWASQDCHFLRWSFVRGAWQSCSSEFPTWYVWGCALSQAGLDISWHFFAGLRLNDSLRFGSLSDPPIFSIAPFIPRSNPAVRLWVWWSLFACTMTMQCWCGFCKSFAPSWPFVRCWLGTEFEMQRLGSEIAHETWWRMWQICECLLMYDMHYYPYRRIVIYIVRVCVCDVLMWFRCMHLIIDLLFVYYTQAHACVY